ncbi:hypothetical protein SAMN05216480_106168 [Pustulibacterium marinum]|uniref:Uncharacterized protein n=1 Tax=Pustulibacterium marinum TaxID=1224947 RepID=A0A1I7H0U5_9FLAO|nr:hypothetical protein [Pustulibacterium marinum]SFU54297.1 hypothetical protein SAMN05216480_106168 [Pustulibacterium marinum]
MAINKDNIIVEGASGKFGKKLVFRQRGVLTIMSKAPKKTTKAPTTAQIEQRELFGEASIYAKSVIANPELKAIYQAKATGNQSAYNVAFKDYLTAPTCEFELSGYTGAIGDIIKLKIKDVIEVTNAVVSMYDAEGVLLEEGNAIQQDNLLWWNYTTTTENASLPGTRIVVKLTSFPGNVYEYVAIIE